MPDDMPKPFSPATGSPPGDAASGGLLAPGQRIARGVCRHLLSHDFVTLTELVPSPGLRVDVMALGPRGEIWVVECKSSRADYMTDRKWQGYLEWCDRFFWAVDADFPANLLPEGTGLMLADGWDAEILRMGPETRLAPARRKAVTQGFARNAALRLLALRDPGAALRL
ncbi:MmcB family DNA repair protein [Fertoebacter nigrum]|uniref:MmcB family DNA repair protein n=1 Tax=Fertoeibacter niger TaxID=2656921 RepID=A0A8X8H6A9_9RHOB|nr:MmcB family DNA repair protein [Fertoeibacter niger]NUB43921.1 MmcB family DNA repair protein [Fertoeibacter niger]